MHFTSNKIKAVIIDDCQSSIDYLTKSLLEYPDFVVSGTANDATKGKLILLNKHPDLLFLDVELPDESGFDMLRDIREKITWPVQIIFYTAYDKYLLQALRESAFDYLLKPYIKKDLESVLERYAVYRKQTETRKAFTESLSRLLSTEESFLIASVDGFQVLRTTQIGYFEYNKQRKLWNVVFNDNKGLQLKRNTTAKDILGYSKQFLQINRNIIINIEYLSFVRGRFCQLYPPFDNVTGLEASIGFIHTLQEKFNQI